VKRAAGKAVGDAKLESEGKAEKIEGTVQNAIGGIKDTLTAIMHEAARFRTHVERASASNPIIWIGMLLLAVQRAWN